MIFFKVKESVLRVGPRKGQKAYSAVPKAPSKFSAAWLVERIVRETSLSEGDVRNVLITLKNITREVVSLGGSLDLGDTFSFVSIFELITVRNEKMSPKSSEPPNETTSLVMFFNVIRTLRTSPSLNEVSRTMRSTSHAALNLLGAFGTALYAFCPLRGPTRRIFSFTLK